MENDWTDDPLLADIPDDRMEDLCIMISEAMEDSHSPTQSLVEGQDGYLWISEVVRWNDTNWNVDGNFYWGGKIILFAASVGDMNGFDFTYLESYT